ncbi:putative RNA-binding protein [Trypanosoma rangeli]|uniref:Putative RNA-binding protein n=1 Tax=Trypanosoma rangeli TaxID=5698 RepID=A0A3R7N0F8_TRYRA|nr:putative RNA-binding protein [Trypanosoma rangeli]RNF10830.1 putative RNA-binding protein [Trypanosoma rangeli]|eukprot:RNF10830.1 putative RNA-binding protein [Trypanosoma rangeli]
MDRFLGTIVDDENGASCNYANNEGHDSIQLFLKTDELADVLGGIGDENGHAEVESRGSDVQADTKRFPTFNTYTGPFSQSLTSNTSDRQVLGSCGKGGNTYDTGAWITDPATSIASMTAPNVTTPTGSPIATKTLEAGAVMPAKVSTAVTPISTRNTVATNSQSASTTGDTVRLSVRNNVYVSELPPHWNTEKLRSVCSSFGTIISAKVVHDGATNKSREYGFVMFETEEQATLCVESLNNCSMAGKILACRLAHERAMPSFAHVESVSWSPCTTANVTPSMGFITPQEASLESSRPCNSESFEASCPISQTGQGNSALEQSAPSGLRKSRNVFIQGLPLHWNTDKLRGLCGTCGKVLRAKVVRDATTSLPCGHGFVLFETEQMATVCVVTLNGFVVEGRTLACRLAHEKRTPPHVSPLNNDGLTATPGMQPLSSSERTSVVTDPLVTPTANFLSPVGIVDASTAQSNIAFMPLSNYGKWPAVGMVPSDTGGGLLQALSYTAMTAPSSFLGQATMATPQSYSAFPSPGAIPGLSAQHAEYNMVPSMEHQFTPLPGIPNTYIIAMPCASPGMGRVSGSSASTMAVATTALPLSMATIGAQTADLSVVSSELMRGYLGPP